MSVTYGFYNSLNGDRKYDAAQISSIFDGLITDGVFASVGTALVVKATTGNTINVGIGRAWFNHTWTFNDSILPIEVPVSEVLLDRIDAVVLEIDSSESVRANSIKLIKGAPATQPVNPILISEELIHQYPLCYIYRSSGSAEIVQSDITNTVGTEKTPFITGILKTLNIDELLGQWSNEFDQFITGEQTDFTEWFDQIKGQLNEDAAGHLQLEINGLITAIENANIALNTKANAVNKVTLSGSTVTIATAEDNTEYIGGTVTSLTVSAYPVDDFECLISFISGTGITVKLPASTMWVDGEAPTFTAGKYYEISIKNKRAVWGEF